MARARGARVVYTRDPLEPLRRERDELRLAFLTRPARFTYLEKPWAIVVSQVAQGDYLALRLRSKVYVLDLRYEKALETYVSERVMMAFQEAGIRPPVVGVRASMGAAAA